jgi:hypothetical protein
MVEADLASVNCSQLTYITSVGSSPKLPAFSIPISQSECPLVINPTNLQSYIPGETPSIPDFPKFHAEISFQKDIHPEQYGWLSTIACRSKTNPICYVLKKGMRYVLNSGDLLFLGSQRQIAIQLTFLPQSEEWIYDIPPECQKFKIPIPPSCRPTDAKIKPTKSKKSLIQVFNVLKFGKDTGKLEFEVIPKLAKITMKKELKSFGKKGTNFVINSKTIGDQHCQIGYDKKLGYFVEDLGSPQGTYFCLRDTLELAEESSYTHPLLKNTKIRIGDFIFQAE